MPIRRLALALSLIAGVTPARSADLTATLEGAPTVVFNASRDGCDAGDIPDVNPRAYRDSAGRSVMFALHSTNRPLRGPDVDHLKIDCHVSLGSPLDPDPARYADRNFIAATWTRDGSAVSALVHHEYHADQHGRCRVTGDLGCWYNTILAYRSDDGGATFAAARPFVVAAPPFTQDVDQGRHRGFFNPSNIVADGPDHYVFVSTTGWTGQPFGNCLLRTSDPGDPALWRAYDGTGFTIRYRDPYAGPAPAKPCATIEPFRYTVGSVVRHRGSGLWLAVFQAAAGGLFPVDGFYYAVGSDLRHWGLPRLLLAGRTLYNDLCKVKASIIAYPSIIDPRASGRNYDDAGDQAELFFTVMQVANCGTGERFLVRQPLTLRSLAATP